jgi:hypothetical protein
LAQFYLFPFNCTFPFISQCFSNIDYLSQLHIFFFLSISNLSLIAFLALFFMCYFNSSPLTMHSRYCSSISCPWIPELGPYPSNSSSLSIFLSYISCSFSILLYLFYTVIMALKSLSTLSILVDSTSSYFYCRSHILGVWLTYV